MRVMAYKQKEGRSYNTLPLYPDRSEYSEIPTVVQEMLREAGIDF
jgi:hypothetical protein